MSNIIICTTFSDAFIIVPFLVCDKKTTTYKAKSDTDLHIHKEKNSVGFQAVKWTVNTWHDSFRFLLLQQSHYKSTVYCQFTLVCLEAKNGLKCTLLRVVSKTVNRCLVVWGYG